MNIYLDSCCLNRLGDDQSQPRVRAEAQAVGEILSFVLSHKIEWTGSAFVEFELGKNPDATRRQNALDLLSLTTDTISPDRTTLERMIALRAVGYGTLDAMHLACAESAGVDVLLTTDDRFLRRAARGEGNPRVRVSNPIDWLNEVLPWLLKK